MDLDFWLTYDMREAFRTRDMGKLLTAYRQHPSHGPRKLSQTKIAEWTGFSQPQISRIEDGTYNHDLNKLKILVNSLHIPHQLLWFEVADPIAKNRYSQADLDEVSTTLRRDFLALTGATIAADVFGLLDSESRLVQMSIDRGTASSERVARFEGMASMLGVQVVRVAPTSVLEPTLVTLKSVRALLAERQPTRLQMRLVQASAKLSTVVGEVMFNEGNFSKAREYYQTAQYAAQDVGDQYLADIALAGMAYLPTYSDNPPGVLALLDPRLDHSPSPSPAVAWLWGMRARAHAALGEQDNFDHAIEMARNALASSSDELVAPGIFSFVPEKLAFYEANGAVLLNRPQRAIEAADSALSLYDMTETTEPALAQIERASALVQSGDMAEACLVAIRAISDPSTYQSVTVRTRAQRFDELLSNERIPEVSEWREVRRELHARREPLSDTPREIEA